MKRILILLLLYSTVYAQTKDFGTVGAVYPVKEKNILTFINKKVSEFDFANWLEQNTKKHFDEAVTGKLILPSASMDKVRFFSKKHILEKEIFTIDSKGKNKIIYPAGFSYNPLEYIQSTEKYIIVNANKPMEIKWLSGLDHPNKIIMITEGHAVNLSKQIDAPVYILTETVAETLDVKVTPSIVYQDGNKLKIEEYYIESKGEHK